MMVTNARLCFALRRHPPVVEHTNANDGGCLLSAKHNLAFVTIMNASLGAPNLYGPVSKINVRPDITVLIHHAGAFS